MRTYDQLSADFNQISAHHRTYQRMLSRNACEDVDDFLDRAKANLECYAIFTDTYRDPESASDFLQDAYKLMSRAWLRYQAQDQFA